MDIFAPWEPKLLMNICILSQKCKDYNIIKHINEDVSYIIYFNPSKHSVKDGYDGDGFSLLCNNIPIIALKDGYHIIRYEFYTIHGSTVKRFSCNSCVPYKGDVKHRSSKRFRLKCFHNDAKNTCGPVGRKMRRRTMTQGAVLIQMFLFFNQIRFIWI